MPTLSSVWIIAALMAASACIPAGVHAASPTRAAAGLTLAQKYCAECHQVTPSRTTSWTDAPDFEVIANRPHVTVASLDSFIQKPHMKMLNTERPPAEANELATYIITLRKH